jgi:hypothetical protein
VCHSDTTQHAPRALARLNGSGAREADVCQQLKTLVQTWRKCMMRCGRLLGETMFPRGATSTDNSMQRCQSGWKETYGLYQTNKALRGGHPIVEYEAFFGQDVADGLQEAWRRPMHWAGFLVMGASTKPPRADAEVGNVEAIDDWLRSIALQDYAAAIKEYGDDSFQALDAGSEEQITEMSQDPEVDMKETHRHLFCVCSCSSGRSEFTLEAAE